MVRAVRVRRGRRPPPVGAFEARIEEIVREAYEPTIQMPKVLYHYTNWRGFNGIVKRQRVWARPHRDAKDRGELGAARTIILEVAQAVRDSFRGTPGRPLEELRARYDEMNIGEEATIFLACFSGARDKASQWRDYADEGRGVCLCFKTMKEAKPEDPPGLSQGMTLVRYGADSWRPLLERCFRDVTAEYAALCKHPGGDKKGFGLVCGALYRIAAVLAIRVKNECYSSEEEWRHASLNRNAQRHLVKLDMSNPRVPHINVQLRRDHLLAFEEIMLGPRQKTGRAVECAAKVLRDAGYSGDEFPPITFSQVLPALVQHEP